jgi:hypothetical protein
VQRAAETRAARIQLGEQFEAATVADTAAAVAAAVASPNLGGQRNAWAASYAAQPSRAASAGGGGEHGLRSGAALDLEVTPAFEAGGDEPPMLLPGAPLAQSSFSEEEEEEEGSASRGWLDGGDGAGGGADDVWRGSRNGHGEDLSSTAVVQLPRRTSLGAAARTASAATLSTLIRGGALGGLASPLTLQCVQAPVAAVASVLASAAEDPPERKLPAPWRPAGLGSPSTASPSQRLAATHSRIQLRAEDAQPLAAAQLASRRMASRLDLAL